MNAAGVVRRGAAGDAAAIAAIYDHHVATSHATFDEQPHPPAWWREWLAQRLPGGKFDLVVAASGGTVAGYAVTDVYNPRAAYRTSVSVSVYRHPDARGLGLGDALYGALFELIAERDLHRAYAGIALPNPASMALHERHGFVRCGYLHEVGFKFGRYWDVALYERHLEPDEFREHGAQGSTEP